MIAGGGGYDGPAALKNTPGGPAKCMDSIKKEKKEACIEASTGHAVDCISAVYGGRIDSRFKSTFWNFHGTTALASNTPQHLGI